MCRRRRLIVAEIPKKPLVWVLRRVGVLGLMQTTASLSILVCAVCLAVAPATRAQELPAPAMSQLEPLPAWNEPLGGPPQQYVDLDAWTAENYGPSIPAGDWCWQVLPDGIIYKAYLANPKESRVSSVLFSEKDDGALWDSTLGGRVGILRYGTDDSAWPQGWQWDLEGLGQVRLDPEENRDLAASIIASAHSLTYGYGPARLQAGLLPSLLARRR